MCVYVQRIIQPGEGTLLCAWETLHTFTKHVCISMHTMWRIVARNVGDNGESTGRVGSWKVRGTERGENIQFNFETAPAQSTNTKASLQPYPCWRLELIQARGGERTAGRKGGGGDRGSNKEISREKRWSDIGRKTDRENGGNTQQQSAMKEREGVQYHWRH